MFAKLKTPLLPALLLTLLLSACGDPDFLDLQGDAINFDDYRGQWLVVNYWAEWCAPCRKEIPELNELHAAADNKISVLGVNFDGPELEKLRKQAADFKIAFPVIQSDVSERFTHPRPEVLPTTYIYNPEGKLVHTLVGPQTKAGLEELVGNGG